MKARAAALILVALVLPLALVVLFAPLTAEAQQAGQIQGDRDYLERALYGAGVAYFITDHAPKKVTVEWQREGTAAFVGPSGADFTRLSGVLWFRLVQLDGIVRRAYKFYPNPQAVAPLPEAVATLLEATGAHLPNRRSLLIAALGFARVELRGSPELPVLNTLKT